METINKESLLNMISALPVTEIDGVMFYPANRIHKTIKFLPVYTTESTELITDHEKDKDMNYAQCKKCYKFIPTISYLMDNIEFCPYCGSKVDTIHNGQWLNT